MIKGSRIKNESQKRGKEEEKMILISFSRDWNVKIDLHYWRHGIRREREKGEGTSGERREERKRKVDSLWQSCLAKHKKGRFRNTKKGWEKKVKSPQNSFKFSTILASIDKGFLYKVSLTQGYPEVSFSLGNSGVKFLLVFGGKSEICKKKWFLFFAFFSKCCFTVFYRFSLPPLIILVILFSIFPPARLSSFSFSEMGKHFLRQTTITFRIL